MVDFIIKVNFKGMRGYSAASANRAGTDPVAKQVKINDLLDNMDITRLQTLTEADVKRLNKYLRAYKRLTNEVGTGFGGNTKTARHEATKVEMNP